mmetsp:Transcript_23604/g.35358  ORF Transcript_23604/g.35358 Transcript_23604/m.35358 type:complete len:96 (-) Transcript_23604:3168-3455(-)
MSACTRCKGSVALASRRGKLARRLSMCSQHLPYFPKGTVNERKVPAMKSILFLPGFVIELSVKSGGDVVGRYIKAIQDCISREASGHDLLTVSNL